MYAIWRNCRLSYIEARLRIYIPTYVEGICRSPAAMMALGDLRRLYGNCLAKGMTLALFDFDGYMTDAPLPKVMTGAKKLGHAFVVMAILRGELTTALVEAARLARIGPLLPGEMPVDLSPFGPAERRCRTGQTSWETWPRGT